jgi:hypothetical protein
MTSDQVYALLDMVIQREGTPAPRPLDGSAAMRHDWALDVNHERSAPKPDLLTALVNVHTLLP